MKTKPPSLSETTRKKRYQAREKGKPVYGEVELITPDASALAEYGIAPEDTSRFIAALKYVQYRANRYTAQEAAKAVGYSAATMHSPLWRDLIRKAELYLIQGAGLQFRMAANTVASGWTDVVSNLVRKASSAHEPLRDVAYATEILWNIYGKSAAEGSASVNQPLDYLKQAVLSNPLAPLIEVNVHLERTSDPEVRHTLLVEGSALTPPPQSRVPEEESDS